MDVIEELTGDPGESGWDRRKRATRQALKHAAAALVEERGLSGVTVDEIAARAGVSTRTFFNYFPTKEDAVVGWDPSWLAELVDHLRHRPSDEQPLDAVRATIAAVVSPTDGDYRELLRRLQVTRSDPHLLAHYALRDGKDDQRLGPPSTLPVAVGALAVHGADVHVRVHRLVCPAVARCRVHDAEPRAGAAPRAAGSVGQHMGGTAVPDGTGPRAGAACAMAESVVS